VKYHDVNRAKLIQQIEEAKTVLEKLLALLQSVPLEPDRFVSHSINPGGSIGRTCENAGKSGKQIERSIISSFRVPESMGFNGHFRHGEGLLQVGE
jgi:hypothetical protein